MRASRAEIGRTAERYDIIAKLPFLRLEKGEPFGNARRGMKAGDALGYDSGDLGWCELAVRRQYPVAVLVALAGEGWADVLTPMVELVHELILDDSLILLYDVSYV